LDEEDAKLCWSVAVIK